MPITPAEIKDPFVREIADLSDEGGGVFSPDLAGYAAMDAMLTLARNWSAWMRDDKRTPANLGEVIGEIEDVIQMMRRARRAICRQHLVLPGSLVVLTAYNRDRRSYEYMSSESREGCLKGLKALAGLDSPAFFQRYHFEVAWDGVAHVEPTPAGDTPFVGHLSYNRKASVSVPLPSAEAAAEWLIEQLAGDGPQWENSAA